MAGIPWHQTGEHGGITRVQNMYLQDIASFAEENGRLPTIRELASRHGRTFRAAHWAVGKLRAKGFLGKDSRGQMTMTDKGRKALGGGE